MRTNACGLLFIQQFSTQHFNVDTFSPSPNLKRKLRLDFKTPSCTYWSYMFELFK